MLSIFETIPYLFLSLFAYLLFYLFGHLLLCSIKVKFENVYVDLWAKSLLGSTLIISFFAIFITKGVTVFCLVPFLLLFPAYQVYQTNRGKPIQYFPSFLLKKENLILMSSLVVFFIVKILYLTKGHFDNAHYLYDEFLTADLLVYARTSDAMLMFGKENTFQLLNQLEPNQTGYAMYHFFELWIIALFKTISGLNAVYLYTICFGIYVYVALFNTYLALCEVFKGKINWLVILLCFLLVFTTSFTFEWVTLIPYVDEYVPYYVKSLLNVPFFDIKRGFVEYYWFSFVIIAGLSEDRRVPVWAAIVICIHSIANAPATLMAVFLYEVYLFYTQKNWARFFESAIYILSFLLLIAGLNVFSPTKLSIGQFNNDITPRLMATPLFYFIDIVKTSIIRLYSFLALFFPFFILGFYFIWKQLPKNILAFLIVLLLSAAFFGAISYQANWSQFYNIPALPIYRLSIVFTAIFIYMFWQKNKILVVFSIITLFGLCAQAFGNYHSSPTYKPEVKYDHEFVEKLRAIGNTNTIGGLWINEQSLQIYRDTPAYDGFSEFLPCVMDKTFILNLTSIENIRKKDYFSGTPLSWVANELAYYAHKGEGRELFEKNEEAFYLNFLSKMNVSFLIVEEGVYLPTYFTSYFQQNYVLCKKSGSRLYIKQ